MTQQSLGLVHERSVSASGEWYTPPWLFQLLGVHFDVDVCSPGADVVPWLPAKLHVTPSMDGLAFGWSGNVWMNHPYGVKDADWIDRFITNTRGGIGICHARTDNAWCKRLLATVDVAVFTKRIKFVDATGTPPKKKNKAGKLVESSPGCGQILYAIGGDNVAAVLAASKDPRLAGLAMRAA